MPWKGCAPVDLRMQFIVRHREGEKMVDLCQEFGISRKTGYKFLERYERLGAVGLLDQSRAPKASRHRVSNEIAALIVREREAHPNWGGRKLKGVLAKRHPELVLPAWSTIGTLLKRRGLVEPRKRRGLTPPYPSPLVTATSPNDLWCTDYKGQFRMGNGQYCYPLTISDRFSRHIMGCEGFSCIDLEMTMSAFELVFRRYGLPQMIRSDNGAPFASRGLWGLTRLSVWWLRLGIWHERIEPACPQQNGQHERMHRELKKGTTRPAAQNLLAQQERFDVFVDEYNQVRPHESLDDKTPAEIYQAAERKMPDRLPDSVYPLHDDTIKVSRAGHIRLGRTQVFLSGALADQLVGLRELNDGALLISFLNYDLGTWRKDEGFIASEAPKPRNLVTLTRANSSEVSPMSPV